MECLSERIPARMGFIIYFVARKIHNKSLKVGHLRSCDDKILISTIL
jgi:hypothetical protein